MKKITSLILSCTMCLTAVAAAGCDKNPPQESSTPTVERLEVETENLMLTLGDTAELSASYNALEGETLSWSSSSPSVVSVDENGHIEALKVGMATITASYGSKKDTCQVEVSLSGNVPTLVFDNNMGEEITLMKGSTFDFSAHVEFNGKTFLDAELEYYVENESIGTVKDGKFTAKEVKGSTAVSVYATWRGQTVHAKTIQVKVIPETTVLLNNGMLTSISVYTVAEHESETYNTSQTISSVFVSEDGTEIKDYTLSVLDQGIASVEKGATTWNITAKKAGKTNLLISYGDNEYSFPIEVKRPVSKLDKTVEYSLLDGKYLETENNTLQLVSDMLENFNNVVSYEYDGKEYKLKNGALNIPVGEVSEVTLYNDVVGYALSFDAYTLMIDELKDFEYIYAGETKTTVEGKYVLIKDIIEPDTVLSMPDGMVPNDFAGTFDGKGHVISFTLVHGTTHAFGIFGEAFHGATIKNLAINVKQTGTGGKNPAGVLCAQGSKQAGTPEYYLENLFIDVSFIEEGSNFLTLMGNVMWSGILKNVIIHVAEVPQGFESGSFARGDSISIANSYVISTSPLYEIDVEESKKPNMTSWKKPILYATYDEMKEAGNDYSSFSAEFWDTVTYGIPVWKTLVEDFTA